MTLGEFLKRYREGKGLSQKQLAELIDVSYFRLQKWESQNFSPKLEDAEKIMRYFVITDFDHLDEKLLKDRIEKAIWNLPKHSKAKPGFAEKAQQNKQKIIKELENDVNHLFDLVTKLQKKIDQVKRES